MGICTKVAVAFQPWQMMSEPQNGAVNQNLRTVRRGRGSEDARATPWP